MGFDSSESVIWCVLERVGSWQCVKSDPHLAQAMSWMTAPKRRNVQLKNRPIAFQ